ncbi:MAG: hypothetical protein J2P17_27025, partial [Mycobacterium sp.]|nr:hypothetical protein [Mycobacterium sp.]
MSHDMPSHDGTDRTARNRRRTFAAVRYRRRLLSRLLLAGIVAAMTATAAWYATTSPKSALATILHPAELVNTNSKLCMGTTGGRLGIGAPVIQFHCTKHFD